jgi:hypothetical protein
MKFTKQSVTGSCFLSIDGLTDWGLDVEYLLTRHLPAGPPKLEIYQLTLCTAARRIALERADLGHDIDTLSDEIAETVVADVDAALAPLVREDPRPPCSPASSA